MADPTPIKIYKMDPDAVFRITIDWTPWLEGETITAASWTVPNGVTVAAELTTGGKHAALISGGTEGQTHLCTSHITTSAGREDERTVAVKVIQR